MGGGQHIKSLTLEFSFFVLLLAVPFPKLSSVYPVYNYFLNASLSIPVGHYFLNSLSIPVGNTDRCSLLWVLDSEGVSISALTTAQSPAHGLRQIHVKVWTTTHHHRCCGKAAR